MNIHEENKKLVVNHISYSLSKITEVLEILGHVIKWNNGYDNQLQDIYHASIDRIKRTVDDLNTIVKHENLCTEDYDKTKIDQDEDLMDADK